MNLLLFLPVFTNACLKMNQLAPPPCACNVLAIDPADVYDYEPKNSNFWANKPQSLLRKPIQVVDDCSVKMYCDGEAKLFIFDKTSIREFGEYAAEGFCDPYTQTVSVDLNGVLTTITNLYGICVLPTDRCACQSLAIQPSNIFQNIPRGHPYYKNVTLNTIKSPIIKLTDCAILMYCTEDYKLLVFDPVVGQSAHTFGNLSVNGSCNAGTQAWSITDGSGKHWSFNQMNGVCVKNSKCPCASLELEYATSEYYLGQDSFYQDFVKDNTHFWPHGTLSADGCQLKRDCWEGAEPIIYWSRSDDPEYALQIEHDFISYETTCDPKTGTWTVNDGATIRNAELFAPMCVYRDQCKACHYITDTETVFDYVPPYDPLFKTLTLRNVKNPILQMKDCVFTMSCESDYSLMILEQSQNISYTFGSLPANGVCDKIAKYWSIEDGIGKPVNINVMFGICLKNSKCPCPSLELNSANARSYLRQDSPVTKFDTTPAITTLSADGCQYMRSCGQGGEHLTGYSPYDALDTTPKFLRPLLINASISGGSTCNPTTGIWTLREGSTVIVTEFFAPMCVYPHLPIT